MRIVEPLSPDDFEKYYQLRWEVLRAPWQHAKGSEKDEQENECIHAMAVTEDNQVIGVCRLQFNSATEGQLRYMGIHPDHQGKGIGRLLLKYMEVKAIEKKTHKLILHARENAVKFYEKAGYSVKETSYLLWGQIQHYLMEKEI